MDAEPLAGEIYVFVYLYACSYVLHVRACTGDCHSIYVLVCMCLYEYTCMCLGTLKSYVGTLKSYVYWYGYVSGYVGICHDLMCPSVCVHYTLVYVCTVPVYLCTMP